MGGSYVIVSLLFDDTYYCIERSKLYKWYNSQDEAQLVLWSYLMGAIKQGLFVGTAGDCVISRDPAISLWAVYVVSSYNSYLYGRFDVDEGVEALREVRGKLGGKIHV